MTDLPKDWREVLLSEVCVKAVKVKPEEFERTTFTYVDIGSINNSRNVVGNPQHLPTTDAPSRARQLLRGGDTVFSTVRPYLRNIAWVDSSLQGEVASTGFTVLRASQEVLLPRFLFYFAISDHLLDQVLPLQQGTSYPAVRDGDVLGSQLPLPSLPEQRRIVEILEEQFSRLDNALASIRAVREKAAAFRRSLLHSAFSGELTGRDNEWISTRLGACVEFLSGYAFRSEWYVTAGVRLARGQNVAHGFLDWTDTRCISEERSKDYSRFALSEGDLLLALDRPLISSGLKWSVVKQADLPALLLQRVARLSAHDCSLRQDFLKYWLQSDSLTGAINPGRSIGVPHISVKELSDLEIHLPPLTVQTHMVEALEQQISRVDNALEIVNRLEAHVASERRSLLHAAFTGELTAKWRESNV